MFVGAKLLVPSTREGSRSDRQTQGRYVWREHPARTGPEVHHTGLLKVHPPLPALFPSPTVRPPQIWAAPQQNRPLIWRPASTARTRKSPCLAPPLKSRAKQSYEATGVAFPTN
mgnify:CR=1 FL=1